MTRPADSGNGNVKRIILGKVSGVYGVSGWIRVVSYTRPRENIFDYPCWQISEGDGWISRKLLEGRKQGKGLIAKLENLDDRDRARALIRHDIAVYREELPELPEDEYYWCDLVTMDVVNREGETLGQVTEIRETGANDVLVVSGQKRHLIPLILDRYVLSIEMERSRITVDWNRSD